MFANPSSFCMNHVMFLIKSCNHAMLLLTPSKYYRLAFGPILNICFALGTLREPFCHKSVSTRVIKTKNDKNNSPEQVHNP
jgi:hypothetical protein